MLVSFSSFSHAGPFHRPDHHRSRGDALPVAPRVEARARADAGGGGAAGGDDVAMRGGDGGDDGDLQHHPQAAQRVRTGVAARE